MPLTLAQMQALFNDNTSGDISAADGRAVMEGLWQQIHGPYSIDDAEDIWWQGDAAGMTAVVSAGTHTITEKDGFLSVVFAGQAAIQFNGLFRARTFSIGDSFCVRIRSLGLNTNYTMTGIAFTDGTATTSNVVAAYPQRQNVNSQFTLGHGVLNNFTTNTWAVADVFYQGMFSDGVYARLTYTASNTFQAAYSPDGVTWSSFAQTTASKTMTPTHVGVIWSKAGGATDSIVSFGPVCKLA